MTKRALLVGALDERPKKEVDATPSVETMSALLSELGDWSVAVLDGPEADRDGILRALERLVEEVEADDEVLFYYFGHGGAVDFRDPPAWIGERRVFYVCGSRTRDSQGMIGVLDVELSAALSKMDEAGARVSALLDCCHSAQIVRGAQIDTPSSVPREDPTDGRSSRQESHPRIVRLAGTSSLSYAYALRKGRGALGLLTEGFAAVVREAGAGVGRLCWDTLAHRVREHAIQVRRCEEQWVTIAGPRERLLFQREHVALPRSVGHVSQPDGAASWLRAGLLQGLELGQQWGLTDLLLDEQHRPQIRARVRVSELGLSRARVEAVDAQAAAELARLPQGSSSLLLDSPSRRAVHVRGPKALELEVANSPLLKLAEASPAWAELGWTSSTAGKVQLRVARRESPLELRCADADPEHARKWAVALLEDWARVDNLRAGLARAPGAMDEAPLRLRWGRCKDGVDQLLSTDDDARLTEGDELHVEIAHRGLSPETWFVSLIVIGVDGRPVLFDPSEPEGRAVAPRRTEYFGRRAFQFKTGRPVRWAEGLGSERSLPLTVMVLSSLRPLELGHIVRATPWGWGRMRGQVGGSVTRRAGPDPGWAAPEELHKWAYQTLFAQVSPRGFQSSYSVPLVDSI